ncbi:FAD/NAD(P)-binding domain-containing protein [Myriangium duriaei CBS 260.36]|uniref:FAD/NAD(P)-binding domain-containing protein n=1 Tax=Myriangium duriaei CBS 260.36 TaxID=1168546 RepID=A0A9P4JD23_9PEZI|nr:FAD/NAD(P)-binding domain-containing protein [Myriangium duriaei CBS 260.36]
MPQLSILISGVGIAGPVLAYWLHRAGHKVTILERDASLRSSGQSIDLRGVAVDIIKLMSIEPAVRAKTTSEAGLAFVDATDKIRALFPSRPNDEGQSFTAEYEILRGELVEILFSATKSLSNVQYIFSESIASLSSSSSSSSTTSSAVEVSFSSSRAPQTFDLVVAADGLDSKTRGMAFAAPTKSYVRSFDCWAAYFTIDRSLLSGQEYCRWYNASGGRCVALRPDPAGRTRANLCLINHRGKEGSERLDKAFKAGTEGMREVLLEEFSSSGWKADEVMQGLREAKDLYGTELAQIRVEELYRGRVVLVGDAGYCPTPLTGMGTSLAVTGAYVLAGELLRAEGDVDAALEKYQGIMLPYARKVQDIPSSLPKIVNPDSRWAIELQLLIFSIVAFLRLGMIAEWVKSWLPAGDQFKLPQYPWPQKFET